MGHPVSCLPSAAFPGRREAREREGEDGPRPLVREQPHQRQPLRQPGTLFSAVARFTFATKYFAIVFSIVSWLSLRFEVRSRIKVAAGFPAYSDTG